MPNGTRASYRLSEQPPSPAHTSDSEETEAHKARFHERRVERRAARLVAFRLIPRTVTDDNIKQIASFLDRAVWP